MAKYYRVTFDTQRNRRYISWEYVLVANSQKEAKEIVKMAWNSEFNPMYKRDDKPHMFHVEAKRIIYYMKDTDRFHKVDERYANWG